MARKKTEVELERKRPIMSYAEFERLIGKADRAKLASFYEWRNFSITPHTEQEIRERCILDAYCTSVEENFVCYCYLCRYQTLSEDFIKELMFISSGLFGIEYYNKESIDLICDIIAHYNYKKKTQKDYVKSLDLSSYNKELVKKIKICFEDEIKSSFLKSSDKKIEKCRKDYKELDTKAENKYKNISESLSEVARMDVRDVEVLLKNKKITESEYRTKIDEINKERKKKDDEAKANMLLDKAKVTDIKEKINSIVSDSHYIKDKNLYIEKARIRKYMNIFGMRDRLDWLSILQYQKLSDEFLKEFKSTYSYVHASDSVTIAE